MKKISESSIQQQSFLWLNNNYGLKHHSPRLKMFSVSNESILLMASILKSYRVPESIVNKATALSIDKMKAMGMVNGVSDTIVVLPNKTLFCEFKVKGNYQSDKQVDFQSIIENLGHKYYVVRSLEEFKEIILEELK